MSHGRRLRRLLRAVRRRERTTLKRNGWRLLRTADVYINGEHVATIGPVRFKDRPTVKFCEVLPAPCRGSCTLTSKLRAGRGAEGMARR